MGRSRLQDRRGPGAPVAARVLTGAFLLVAACSTPKTMTTTSFAPKAPVHEVVDEYFGQRIVDPYRWMETPGSADFRAWLEAQNRQSRAALDALPLHATVARRTSELIADLTSVEEARLANQTFFYVERSGESKPVLRMRSRAGGDAKTLVDLEGTPYSSIDYLFPSPSGRFVAFGASSAGDEDSVLRIVEVATLRVVDRPVEHCRFAQVAWLADESAFFYTREPPRRPGAAESEAFTGMRVHRHVLGTDVDADPPLAGFGVAASPFVEKDQFPRLVLDDASPYAVVAFDHGVDDPVELALKRTSDVGDLTKPWQRIATSEDGIVSFALRGKALYVLTFKEAPFHRLERWDLEGGAIVARRVLLEQRGLTLRTMARSRSGIYVSGLARGVSELHYVPFDGGAPSLVALPNATFVSALVADPRSDGAALRVESWTSAPRWFTHESPEAAIADARLVNASPVAFDGIVVRQLTARSADGTEVPITVLHRSDLHLDGRNPTWLGAYGSYGIALVPSFRPLRKAWLERGGVFAFAHVRGGGELGKPWHEGGQKLNKINSILDFIATAEALVQARITSPAHLAAFGQSAGGIVAHGAVVRRPELFGAAVVDVGDANMLRLEQTPGGPMNTREFGSVKTPDGFRALFEMDAYHHVKPGVRYPAVLLSTGINDPRVPPWQSAKMAARLQASTGGDRPILLRVSFDDGHGVGSTRRQEADRYADFFTFLFWQLDGAAALDPAGRHP
jgi:prolyl oligopeptidase